MTAILELKPLNPVTKDEAPQVQFVWVDSAKVLAAAAVVMLHVAAPVVEANPIGSSAWHTANIYDSATRWCVPMFVMISGVLLLDGQNGEAPSTFYRKRVSRILLPLLFWSAIYLGWRWHQTAQEGGTYTMVSAAKALLLGRPYYHLWYLFMLLGLYLFTPLLRALVRSLPRAQLAFFIASMFVLAAITTGKENLLPNRHSIPLFTNWFLAYLPYFLTGYLIQTNEVPWSRRSLWATLLISGAMTAIGCYLVSAWKGREAGAYFYAYLSITVIPMSVSIMVLVRKCRWSVIGTWPKLLAPLTFGIYLVHPLVLEVLTNTQITAIPAAIGIPIVWAATLIVSAVIVWGIAGTFLRRVV